jgi:hypothetical protein
MKYTFNHPDSLIHDVEIFAAGKGLNAIISAPEGSNEADLASVKTMLNQKGFNVVADVERDKHLLRLTQVGSAENLLTALADSKHPAVVGNYTAELTEREQKENKSLSDLMKEKQLTMAGLLYLAADMALIASGVYRTKGAPKGSPAANVLNNETVGGILWAIPSVLLIAAGQQSPEVVNGFAMRDIKKKLNDHGITIPEDAQTMIDSGAAGRSLWDRAVETVYNHAPEINNAMQIWGGWEMSQAGMKQENAGKQAAGLLVMLGMGLGLILPEKDKHAVAANGLGEGTMQGGGSPLDALTKKGGLLDQPPQFYAGLFPRVNNILNLLGGINEKIEWNHEKTWLGQDEAKLNFHKTNAEAKSEYKHLVLGKKHYQGRIDEARMELEASTTRMAKLSGDALKLEKGYNQKHATALETAKNEYNTKNVSAQASSFNMAASLLYIGANQCYSHTSKENTADIELVGGKSTILAAFANIVLSHPQEERPALSEQLSMLLAEDKHINLSLEEASRTLAEKVTALEKSPWLNPTATNNITPINRHTEVPAATSHHASIPEPHVIVQEAQGRMQAAPVKALT